MNVQEIKTKYLGDAKGDGHGFKRMWNESSEMKQKRLKGYENGGDEKRKNRANAFVNEKSVVEPEYKNARSIGFELGINAFEFLKNANKVASLSKNSELMTIAKRIKKDADDLASKLRKIDDLKSRSLS